MSAPVSQDATSSQGHDRDGAELLVFSRTVLYRHESIPTAVEAIKGLGYRTTFSEDPSIFDDYDGLIRFRALLFLSPSGDILDTSNQKENLSRYIQEGGGLLGVHSATSALRDVPTYTNAFGAILDRHSVLQDATFTVHTHNHPSTACLRPSWRFKDEVYFFQTDPRLEGANLLLTVDPKSYHDPLKDIQKQKQGGLPHPIAWYREGSVYHGSNAMNRTGRVWYTSIGHTVAIWQDPCFIAHIKGGVDWVLEAHGRFSGVASQ